jgi:hypothetical protein
MEENKEVVESIEPPFQVVNGLRIVAVKYIKYYMK